ASKVPAFTHYQNQNQRSKAQNFLAATLRKTAVLCPGCGFERRDDHGPAPWRRARRNRSPAFSVSNRERFGFILPLLGQTVRSREACGLLSATRTLADPDCRLDRADIARHFLVGLHASTLPRFHAPTLPRLARRVVVVHHHLNPRYR